jgi:8-amino-7-oxononanoate synthase
MSSSSLDSFVEKKIKVLERRNLRRQLVQTEAINAVEVIRTDKRFISFSSNDYLGFTQHPIIKEAAIKAIEKFGVGSGASRLVTGNHPLFDELESKLAKLKGAEDAIVMGSGYLTNIGVIPALIGAQDVVYSDELSHACLLSGSRLSGGEEFLYRHNDLEHLRELLSKHRASHRNALIVTDGVFSMDGDLAPVEEILELANEFDAWLMTDDAHGIGVVGSGRGSGFVDGEHCPVPLQMGTLSKAIGGYGGYLCASTSVIDFLRNRCRSFIYSTGLAPASVASAIAALDIIEADPKFAQEPLRKAQIFTTILDLPPAQSPIVPVILGDTEKVMAAARYLENEGNLVVPIRPPTVPMGTARLRVTFSAMHDDSDVERLANLIKNYLANGA